MKWYYNLYTDSYTNKKIKKIRRKVERNVAQLGIYLIVLSPNPKEQLELVDTMNLLQKNYPKQTLEVIGIASNRNSAMNLVVSIVDDVYKMDPNCNLKAYFRSGGETI